MSMNMKQAITHQVPRHVAIIPDGNRRWARNKGLRATAGHKKAAALDNLIPLLETAREIGMQHVTFWAFSTDNWKRSAVEKRFLFGLLERFASDFRGYAIREGIRFRHFGRKDRLPKSLSSTLARIEAETADFDSFQVNICLDYSGRDELVRTVNKIIATGTTEVTEEILAEHLDSARVPDPDFVIRTSGEQRTSGFMPFQTSYAEFYFEEAHFPDFGPSELRKAVASFGKRARRFGE